MPKISELAVGQYIRNPRNPKKIMRIEQDAGNSFVCYNLKNVESGRVTLDTSAYSFIDKSQNVERVEI